LDRSSMRGISSKLLMLIRIATMAARATELQQRLQLPCHTATKGRRPTDMCWTPARPGRKDMVNLVSGGAVKRRSRSERSAERRCGRTLKRARAEDAPGTRRTRGVRWWRWRAM
jgi:hypothetical protein